jgi:hypothetical protein
MIPSNLVYSGKVESSPARRYRTNIQPQNGTGPYVGGNTVIINIPTQANTFLIPSESYLKFTLAATIGASASNFNAFDAHGAHGVIQRLRVYHGSSLLQDIDNYDDLAKILFDYQAALDTTQGRLSITNGTNAEYTGVLNGAAGTATVSNVKPTNKGATIAALAASGTRTIGTYAINLISLVGSLAGGKYLPLHFAQSAPLRVELVLKSTPQQVGAFTGNATAIQLSGVEYIAEFLQMSSGAIDAIAQRAGGSLQMVVPDWRNYVYSSNVADNATITMPVAAKFSSLKSLVVSQRQTAASGVATYYPCAHVKNGLSQWTIRIGSELLPSTAPNTDSEFFSEAAKCFGSLADMNYQPSIDINAFTQAAAVAVTSDDLVARTDSGAFLIGLDCETYQNSDKSSIFAGMDTTTSDIFVNMVYGTTPSTGANITYNAFACFDNVVVFENGAAYSRT